MTLDELKKAITFRSREVGNSYCRRTEITGTLKLRAAMQYVRDRELTVDRLRELAKENIVHRILYELFEDQRMAVYAARPLLGCAHHMADFDRYTALVDAAGMLPLERERDVDWKAEAERLEVELKHAKAIINKQEEI